MNKNELVILALISFSFTRGLSQNGVALICCVSFSDIQGLPPLIVVVAIASIQDSEGKELPRRTSNRDKLSTLFIHKSKSTSST